MTTGGVLESFAVTTTFVEGGVVLAIRGDVDLVSAPELGALVAAVVERGHRQVTLDLAALSFIDAAGLGVVASAASELRRTGRELVLRSPSALLVRLLDITLLTDSVRLEHAYGSPGRLGPEQVSSAHLGLRQPELVSLADQLRRVAAIPASDDVVDGALRLVVALARATVSGADGVSVSLQRHGRLATVAASDQTIRDMDADQYATGEGPCVDASVKGRWFHSASLESETRWPEFTPRARELGINAILSSPLLADERPVGALNIYSRTSDAFSDVEQELAGVFAIQASTILRDAGVSVSEEELSDRLSDALTARHTISLAQGVLMEREAIGDDEAYTVLRSVSQRTSQPLREAASEIVQATHSGPS